MPSFRSVLLPPSLRTTLLGHCHRTRPSKRAYSKNPMAYEVSIELTCPDTAPASIRLPRYWSAMRDLNPRPRAPKARALPSCANRRNSGMRGENSEPPVHSSRPDDRKHPLKLVGLVRFELTTPCPPDRCANQAALQPETRGLMAMLSASRTLP